MPVQNVPAPKQPAAPMSEIDVMGGTTLTTPVAAPAAPQPSGSPDQK